MPMNIVSAFADTVALCKLARGIVCKDLAHNNGARIPAVGKNILMNLIERHEETRRMRCWVYWWLGEKKCAA
jgi:hypothetical protein